MGTPQEGTPNFGKLPYQDFRGEHQRALMLQSRKILTNAGISEFHVAVTLPRPKGHLCKKTQRVHVGIWYILRAQKGSHIPTLRPKYIPYSYMDPLGKRLSKSGALNSSIY